MIDNKGLFAPALLFTDRTPGVPSIENREMNGNGTKHDKK